MKKIKIKPILFAKIKQPNEIEDDKKVVVVKKRFIEIIFEKIGLIIKIISNILIFTLAFIGLISLVYPETRQGIFDISNDIIRQIGEFF